MAGKGSKAIKVDIGTLTRIYGRNNVWRAYNSGARLQPWLRALGIGHKGQTYTAQRITGNAQWSKTFSGNYILKRGVAERWNVGSWRNELNPSRANIRTSKSWTSSNARRGALTPSQWAAQLTLAAHMVEISSVNFVQVMTRYAHTVFTRSFASRRFYSAEGTPWPPITEFTLKMRRKRGSHKGSTHILDDLGKLKGSLKEEFGFIGKRFRGAVVTSPVTGTYSTHKGKTICYASIHNDPYPSGYTYGTKFGAKPAKERKFMGFSTYIDNFAIKIRDNYFLNDVFLFT